MGARVALGARQRQKSRAGPERNRVRSGPIPMCIGGGQGITLAVEQVA